MTGTEPWAQPVIAVNFGAIVQVGAHPGESADTEELRLRLGVFLASKTQTGAEKAFETPVEAALQLNDFVLREVTRDAERDLKVSVDALDGLIGIGIPIFMLGQEIAEEKAERDISLGLPSVSAVYLQENPAFLRLAGNHMNEMVALHIGPKNGSSIDFCALRQEMKLFIIHEQGILQDQSGGFSLGFPMENIGGKAGLVGIFYRVHSHSFSSL